MEYGVEEVGWGGILGVVGVSRDAAVWLLPRRAVHFGHGRFLLEAAQIRLNTGLPDTFEVAETGFISRTRCFCRSLLLKFCSGSQEIYHDYYGRFLNRYHGRLVSRC